MKIDQVIDINRISTLTKLLCVTALMLQFVRKVKNNVRGEKKTEDWKSLGAYDLSEAEGNCGSRLSKPRHLLKKAIFSRTEESTQNLPLTSRNLNCSWRTISSSVKAESVIHHFLPTQEIPFFCLQNILLLCLLSEMRTRHSGIRDTLTTFRECFWILRRREAVKQFIRKCVICRRYEGLSYKSNPTVDLPSERVSEDPPFTHVGLDFAGPLFVTDGNSKGANESSKVYVCLFTCASTRAVHLEMTRGLGVQAFLLAFQRITTRQGLPATLNSHNAKTFKSSCKEIHKITRAEEVWRFLTNKRIKWNFIIEKAPWWGGYWEHLVQSIKRPLRKKLGRSTLTFDYLRLKA